MSDPWVERAKAWLAQYDGEEDKSESVDGLAELMANEAMFADHLKRLRQRLNDQVQRDLYRMLAELIRGGKHEGWSVERITHTGALELKHRETGDKAMVEIVSVDARMADAR